MSFARAALRPRIFAVLLAAVSLASVAFLTGCSPEVNAEVKATNGINAVRVKNGLPALRPDAALVNIARIRSRDMAQNRYFSHTPPDGCNFVCLMDENGVAYAYAGENIAWNNWPWDQTADRAVTMWENSAPHMENILNCRYERFGTGVASTADGRVYYTMIFEGNASC